MKFFGRVNESKLLQEIAARSLNTAQFTVLSGARRIGKTSLVRHVYSEENMLYFFVSKKSEQTLCSIFQKEIENKLGIPMPDASMRFEQIFDYIMRLSHTRPITLFIDEFQLFGKVDASIYADMQKVWDREKEGAKLNLIVGGSAKTLLLRLFEDKSEPLYGRQTNTIKLQHFYPTLLKEILLYHNPSATADDLLTLYCLTGGVARYVELLMDAGAVTRQQMIREVVRPSSIFLAEGQNHLIEEFGKDYGTYFAILTAIASNHKERKQIENMVGREIGGHLAALEDTYGTIRKHQPLFATSNKTVRYSIDDGFYIFWFRFIFNYNYMLEIGAHDKLVQIIERDFDTFSGKQLESMFRDVLIESCHYTRIDTWWSRNGKSEIDLIAINELDKTAEFYEVKRQPKEFDPTLLNERVNEFLIATRSLKGYKYSQHQVSLEDLLS